MASSFLLDTHTLLWFLSGNNSISKSVKSIVLDVENKSYVSIASIWEIAIKVNLGKLDLDFEIQDLSALLFRNEIELLQISFAHINELSNLELIHRDPFDRLIISQAKAEGLVVLSKDKQFAKYQDLLVHW